MLEAVHSVLQSAPVVRAQAEQVSPAESFAANPDRVQKAPVQAPFVSPYIFVDVALNKAVIQIRNGDTGDVLGQFPTEASLRARASSATPPAQAPAPQQSAPAHESDSAQAFVQNTAPPPVDRGSTNVSGPAATQQQQAAFAAAARAGNTNAGTVTLFA